MAPLGPVANVRSRTEYGCVEFRFKPRIGSTRRLLRSVWSRLRFLSWRDHVRQFRCFSLRCSSRSISARHNSFRPISFAFSLVVLKLIAQCLQPQCSPGSWDGVGTSDTEGDRCRSWLPEELWRDSRPCGRIGPRLRNNGALCPLCNQISVTWPYYRRTVVNRFMAGALNQSPMVGSCHVTVQSSASGATSGPNFG
jgi:hypothetical protein